MGIGLGIGGKAGLWSGSSGGGTVGSQQVFRSPITPDLTTADASPADHPATWVLVGAAAWMLIVYFHFHKY